MRVRVPSAAAHDSVSLTRFDGRDTCESHPLSRPRNASARLGAQRNGPLLTFWERRGTPVWERRGTAPHAVFHRPLGSEEERTIFG